MDRTKVFVFVLGAAVGTSALAAYAFFPWAGVITSPDCPLEFGVSVLNTTYGWFYRVVGLEAGPRPLDEYTVTFFVLASSDSYGNRQEVVHFSGPLMSLVGASGNFSFEDRGSIADKLDSGGDYFWAREWHNLRVERAGTIVGGTLGCA